jgi:hypothetical protein
LFQTPRTVESRSLNSVRPTGIPPEDPHESALIATVAPGNYTAVVRGVGGGTGIGLVEIHDLNQ